METSTPLEERSKERLKQPDYLPPTPPETVDNSSDLETESRSDSICEDGEITVDIPLPPPSNAPLEVLALDKKTPDAHVPRDPRLIRLTGVHPFNSEAPLSALFNEGFLTSLELFYVRNHGAVPEVHDEDVLDWEFSVSGLVDTPLSLTLRQLIAEYEQVTLPITLVCAGNRRKEANQVRKSKGFSWGPAGVSTALFTGALLADVIRKAKPRRGARYVCMEGADELPNGNYATSLKLNWVLDPEKGMMIAHQMNGEALRPDHGRPLRVVIPGQIGARSVKWLKKLIVTEGPSTNWYHIYDNRVLPTMISPEVSSEGPKWWVDERYAIYELSTNSAVAFPAHNETICVVNGPLTYQAKGYAYSGGGRRITRVEISLDKGQSWRLANIEYAEDRYRQVEKELYGGRLDMSWRETCFCWCHWSLDIPVLELAGAKDLLVRAMDEAMGVQPRDMYWSVLGMMNNSWFRVTITKEGDSLRFDHPTQPALMPGGWMEKVKKAGGNLTNGYWGEQIGVEEGEGMTKVEVKEVSMKKDGLRNTITIDELRQHDGEIDPWFVVNGEVYDGTKFLKEHPGGAQSIISAAGLDCSDEFMAIHSETAKALMPTYHIGSLTETSIIALREGETRSSESSSPRPTFLQSRVWTTAILHSKRTVSWDTRIFIFKLEHEEQTLGLPVGQHLMIRMRDPASKESIIRAYTPISATSQKGMLEVLVKIYFDTQDRHGGKMSQAMDAFPLGQGIDFKGPIGKFEYRGRGLCALNGREKRVGHFIMICAGSGITPIFQVFRAVMCDGQDPTRCLVLDGNRLPEDILCKAEMDALAREGQGRGTVLYTLTKAPEGWTGLKGRIDKTLLARYCAFDPDTLVLVCGPEPLEKAMRRLLGEMGWADEQVVVF